MALTAPQSRRKVMLAASRKAPVPGLRVEQQLFAEGATVVAGLDEVGRGAWAGPVTVGAVAITPNPRRITKLRDSKVLTLEEREALYPRITAAVLAYGVGHATHEECDGLGMTGALRAASERALAALAEAGCVPDQVILDGNFDYLGRPDLVTTVVDGDASCVSVAAASVVAKVVRDRMMAEMAHCYPAFDFDSNRGYPSPRHRCALLGYGPTAIHRRSWVYMDNLPWGQALPAQTNLFG